MSSNFYDILEVPFDATREAIKKAYRKKATKVHPDKNGGSKESEEAFKKLGEAYETLFDEQKRRAYDYANGFKKRVETHQNPPVFNSDSFDWSVVFKVAASVILIAVFVGTIISLAATTSKD